ncbi:hypothetical protein [Streptomyces qinzhouensis]|uniref:Lipoprotein n=1 Tax=Streptomyces qinzhouensis TaxID=2599401 RepID=A0A5B8JEQ6_9ACTN|nr:hypothetical protein [Streptomyces qinzhouensis]QDY80255.1 hypothetical protein FQU76_31290 [Streptomyces qinzhouensis]
MRAIRAASAALLATTVLALAAPVARAGGDGKSVLFTVSPSTVAPGGRVALSASNCTTTATASSGVFDTATIRPGTSATATVDTDARRGAQYSVRFTCGSQQGTFVLTISGGSASPTISSTYRPPATTATPAPSPSRTVTATATRGATATATVTPQGVRGGLGGSIGGGAGTGEFAVGAVFVAVAAAGTGYVLRRRTAGRRH